MTAPVHPIARSPTVSAYAVATSLDLVTKAAYSHISQASAIVMPDATAISRRRSTGACAAPASRTTAAARDPVAARWMASSNQVRRS
ncbi:hypothetical protein [Nocardioides sp. S5]|uniref:hypothetical protein n=1 Tax=Nocardioides sp. S5 TaxID=2017486 RepID=UPI001A8DEACD|nr:hypothetical protein [Nocardioides sp. S5]